MNIVSIERIEPHMDRFLTLTHPTQMGQFLGYESIKTTHDPFFLISILFFDRTKSLIFVSLQFAINIILWDRASKAAKQPSA